MNLKDLNIENLVRSAVVLAVGLPVAFSVGGLTDTIATNITEDPASELSSELKQDLLKPCVLWNYSKADSKLERESMNQIDEVMGGDVTYSKLCAWVL